MIQETSRQAYKTEILPTKGTRQREVLSLLASTSWRDWTNNEIAQALDWPINTVTPRVHELRQKGFLAESDKRKCAVTGRTAIAWKVIGESGALIDTLF